MNLDNRQIAKEYKHDYSVEAAIERSKEIYEKKREERNLWYKSIFYSVLNFIIIKLAGERPIIINAKINGILDLGRKKNALVCNTEIVIKMPELLSLQKDNKRVK